jgi:hypothetical protein
MKKLFLLLVIIAFAVAAQAQTERIRWVQIKNAVNTVWCSGDTVEIKDTSIHFIKIGGKVFEIKQSVELKPAGLQIGEDREPPTNQLHLTPYSFMVPAPYKSIKLPF